MRRRPATGTRWVCAAARAMDGAVDGGRARTGMARRAAYRGPMAKDGAGRKAIRTGQGTTQLRQVRVGASGGRGETQGRACDDGRRPVGVRRPSRGGRRGAVAGAPSAGHAEGTLPSPGPVTEVPEAGAEVGSGQLRIR